MSTDTIQLMTERNLREKQSMLPRKQRTREHVIADQSVHHVEGFIIDEGHVAHRVHSDYGYDLFMETFDGQGYLEPEHVRFQVKASESLLRSGNAYVFDLDVRDCNLWMMEQYPVILVLFDASSKKAYWECIQQYFEATPNRRPKAGAKSVRVRISPSQLLNRHAIARMRTLKQQFIKRAWGV